MGRSKKKKSNSSSSSPQKKRPREEEKENQDEVFDEFEEIKVLEELSANTNSENIDTKKIFQQQVKFSACTSR